METYIYLIGRTHNQPHVGSFWRHIDQRVNRDRSRPRVTKADTCEERQRTSRSEFAGSLGPLTSHRRPRENELPASVNALMCCVRARHLQADPEEIVSSSSVYSGHARLTAGMRENNGRLIRSGKSASAWPRCRPCCMIMPSAASTQPRTWLPRPKPSYRNLRCCGPCSMLATSHRTRPRRSNERAYATTLVGSVFSLAGFGIRFRVGNDLNLWIMQASLGLRRQPTFFQPRRMWSVR